MDDKNADTNVVQVVDYVIERECELTQVKSKREKRENENFTQDMFEKIFSSYGKKFPPLDILQPNSSWPIIELDLTRQG